MTVSSYFKHTTAKNEQKLVDDITIETIQMKGLDLYYIPREVLDNLYCITTNGFSGTPDIVDDGVFNQSNYLYNAELPSPPAGPSPSLNVVNYDSANNKMWVRYWRSGIANPVLTYAGSGYTTADDHGRTFDISVGNNWIPDATLNVVNDVVVGCTITDDSYNWTQADLDTAIAHPPAPIGGGTDYPTFTFSMYTLEDLVDDGVTLKQRRNFNAGLTTAVEKIDGLDYLFGEDAEKRFGAAIRLEMLVQDIEGYQGEGDIVSVFGLDIRDECTFTIAKTRFEQEVTDRLSSITVPREGDLVAFGTGRGLFEIMFVEDERPFYQIGKGHAYELRCKKFAYSHERLSTGIEEIDDIEDVVAPSDTTDVGTEAADIINFDENDPFSSNTFGTS